MADFNLTDEERMVQQLAHEFAVKEIRPRAAYYDEHEELPRDLIAKASELGLAAGIFGGGAPGLTGVIIAEELAWGCAGVALAIAASGLAAAAIAGMGTPEQQARFLPMAISSSGEVRLGAMGLTEPEAGSDVQAIATTAVRDGDDYVLNGTKRFITNGGIADVHVIFATEDRSKGWGGLAAFVVEKGTAGLSEGTVWKKMGIRASHTADVILEDCRVPAGNRLGPPPGGSSNGGPALPGALGALKMLERTRPSIGAFALGIARASLEYATDYAKERKQFGKPLIAHEGIAFKLADMAMAYDAARLLVHRAAWLAATGAPLLRAEGSMAKCYASDVAMQVSLEAVQICGGYGYMREFPVEKWVRDAKIFQIFEGTNEIQRLVISRALASAPR
ncbi:MAG TPA: acyl-CoA dehydrogenase family protein [Dehalococcoidia bacterium]|nr:acyl-CoA dehydrogenase family protein [Dehalococcoidia bacterium]